MSVRGGPASWSGAALAVAAVLPLAACGTPEARARTLETWSGTITPRITRLAARIVTAPAEPRATGELGARIVTAPATSRATGELGARIVRDTPLRATPGGRFVARMHLRTGFHSRRVMAVVRTGQRWIAVRAVQAGNAGFGWVRAADVELFHEPVVLVVDLSKRRLTLLERGRFVLRIPVAVGAATSPTPAGSFGVTDRLTTKPGSPYGCCALALTARQPNIPQGWGGGDRIAIHGTLAEWSVGTAASHGCLRARESDLRRLMARVPIGATVRIRA